MQSRMRAQGSPTRGCSRSEARGGASQPAGMGSTMHMFREDEPTSRPDRSEGTYCEVIEIQQSWKPPRGPWPGSHRIGWRGGGVRVPDEGGWRGSGALSVALVLHDAAEDDGPYAAGQAAAAGGQDDDDCDDCASGGFGCAAVAVVVRKRVIPLPVIIVAVRIKVHACIYLCSRSLCQARCQAMCSGGGGGGGSGGRRVPRCMESTADVPAAAGRAPVVTRRRPYACGRAVVRSCGRSELRCEMRACRGRPKQVRARDREARTHRVTAENCRPGPGLRCVRSGW